MHRYNFDETVMTKLDEIVALLTRMNEALETLVIKDAPEESGNNPLITYTYVDEWE